MTDDETQARGREQPEQKSDMVVDPEVYAEHDPRAAERCQDQPAQGFAWSNMFVRPDDDPRSGGFQDERTVLVSTCVTSA